MLHHRTRTPPPAPTLLQLVAAKAQLRAALAGLSAGHDSGLDVAAMLAGLPPEAGDLPSPAPHAAGATFAPSVGALEARGDAASAAGSHSPGSAAWGRAGGGGAGSVAGLATPAHRSVAAGLAAVLASAPASPGFGAPPRAVQQQQQQQLYRKPTTSSSHRAASVAVRSRRGGPGGGDAPPERARGGRSSSVPPLAGPDRRYHHLDAQSPYGVAAHSRRPAQLRQHLIPQRDADAALAWWTAAPDRLAAAEARDAAAAGLSVADARAELRRLVARVLERWAALPGYDDAEAANFLRASQRVAAPGRTAQAAAAGGGGDAAAVDSPAAAYRQEALTLREGRQEETQVREARLSVLLAEWAAEGRVVAKATAAGGGGSTAAAAAEAARRRLELLEPQIREHRAWLAARKGRPGSPRPALIQGSR